MLQKLAPDLPYLLLAQISRRQRHRMAALLQGIGLHCGQHWILLAIHDMEGASQAALASQIHVSAASLTVTLQRLEKAGLVERLPDPEDQRVSRVYLTAAGHSMQERITQILYQVNAEAFAGMSEQELEQTKSVLQRILTNLNRHCAEQDSPHACQTHLSDEPDRRIGTKEEAEMPREYRA